jgi:uncharacterized protein
MTSKTPHPTCTAFHGSSRAAAGSYLEVALAVKELFARDAGAPVLIFDDRTGAQIDFDLRGTAEDISARLAERLAKADETSRGPGRPKLGVVAREVTLLPRHWEWLAEQPGGASVTLRKLVEEARRGAGGAAEVRKAQERAYKFMSAMAGNLPNFEEASRALFAGDRERFAGLIGGWPADIREHATALAFKPEE